MGSSSAAPWTTARSAITSICMIASLESSQRRSQEGDAILRSPGDSLLDFKHFHFIRAGSVVSIPALMPPRLYCCPVSVRPAGQFTSRGRSMDRSCLNLLNPSFPNPSAIKRVVLLTSICDTRTTVDCGCRAVVSLRAAMRRCRAVAAILIRATCQGVVETRAASLAPFPTFPRSFGGCACCPGPQVSARGPPRSILLPR